LLHGPTPNPASGEQRPALFRPCRRHGRPDTPEGEGLNRFYGLHSPPHGHQLHQLPSPPPTRART
jgi:hypothetical protein